MCLICTHVYFDSHVYTLFTNIFWQSSCVSSVIARAPLLKEKERERTYGERGCASLQRGSGGFAPSGVQGQSPWSGGQGGEAPLKLKLCYEFCT